MHGNKQRSARLLQAARADKAEKRLAEWIKKGGIAMNKIREYTEKVAYYRKVLGVPAKRGRNASHEITRKFDLEA